MRADKDSIDYQVNLVALQEMEEAVPMTQENDSVSESGFVKAMKSNQIHGTIWILTECP